MVNKNNLEMKMQRINKASLGFPQFSRWTISFKCLSCTFAKWESEIDFELQHM